MIYLIQAGKTAVKIGYTKSISGRYTILQVANYEELIILHLIEGDLELESRLHYAARKYRIRNEWYKKEILEDIKVMDIVNNGNKVDTSLLPSNFYKKYSRKLKQAFIRELREAKGWSQEDLAVKLSVSEKTVAQWESGSPILKRYREQLRCILDY